MRDKVRTLQMTETARPARSHGSVVAPDAASTRTEFRPDLIRASWRESWAMRMGIESVESRSGPGMGR